MTRKIIHKMGPSFRDEFLQPFDTVFDKLVGETFPDMTKEFGIEFFGSNSYPKVDIIDRNKDILLEAEVPGLTKDDVSVEVKDNILAVSGERKVKRDDDAVYVRKELKRSSFKRSFSLGDNLDSERISAEFENGILTITIPKIKPVQVEARRVEIK